MLNDRQKIGLLVLGGIAVTLLILSDKEFQSETRDETDEEDTVMDDGITSPVNFLLTGGR